jgi:glycosyltransferase involved in cell wall biosynthesis
MRSLNQAVHSLRGEATPSRGSTSAATNPPAGRTLRIVFLARSLGYGGAERQLGVLASGLRHRGHSVSVLTFYPGGELEPDLRASGVRIRSLDKRGRWDVATFLANLHRVLREESPNVLHSYLGMPNIVAGVTRSLFPGMRVVWGERASNMDLSQYDWLSRFSTVLARVLSRTPDLVIVNSRAAFEYAAAHGYPRAKMIVIPNGIDAERFTPDPAARRRVRDEWQVGTDRLVGLVARLDPVKDHRTFLSAAAQLARGRSDIRFVCVGDGDPVYGRSMQRFAAELGIADRVSWVPARPDMPAVYNALDVACLSSNSESFPNVLGEAMSCGVPCVSTNVGDVAWLLGRPASIAPVGDAPGLADRIRSLLDLDAESIAAIAREEREQVVTQFSVASLVANTERALSSLFDGPTA